jgi:hypothetical protein
MQARSHLRHLLVGIRAVWLDYDFTRLFTKKRLGSGYAVIHYWGAAPGNHFAQGVRFHDIPQLRGQ